MKLVPWVVAAVGMLVAEAAKCPGGCYRPLPDGVTPPSHIVTPEPHTRIKATDVPTEWDWRNVNGTNFCTRARTQFLPRPCGSCWSFGVTGALSDRFKIATGGRVVDVDLAPQVLLNLADEAGSCNGGNDVLAYQFIHENGITDETCMPYEGVDISAWGEFSQPIEQMCRMCGRFGNCSFAEPGTFPLYNVSEFGSVLGVAQMQAEILARGPIACSVYAHSPAFEEYKGGVIVDPTVTKDMGTTHVISVVGWGQTAAGQLYWIGRNSFGSSWGEQLGWFRLERGTNQLNMETHTCAWGVPDPRSVRALLRQFAGIDGLARY
jgi:cathepsin X